VMVHANPDIYLFDEVMAVGDAAFQEKASETFSGLRERGHTVILVTHSMPSIEQLCDRAMRLEGGSVAAIGAPPEVTGRYLELNREHAQNRAGETLRGARHDHEPAVSPRLRAEVVKASVVSRAGGASRLEEGEPIALDAVVAVRRPIRSMHLWLELRDERDMRFFASSAATDDGWQHLDPGQRVRLRVTLENPLTPGNYTLSWAVLHTAPNGIPVAVSAFDTRAFRVAGKRIPRSGPVDLALEIGMESIGGKTAARTSR
jgi:ABC-type sulfate/molybdate transport systems ATPase subunit